MKLHRTHPTFPSVAQEVDSVRSAVLDAGPLPVSEFTTMVSDGLIVPSSNIVGMISGSAPGKDDDDTSMDSFALSIVPGAGVFTVTLRGLEGYIADKFTLNYAS